MIYLISGLILILFVSRIKDNSILRPSNMFVLVWLIVSVLFSLRFLEYDIPKSQTYLVIFLGVLGFCIGGKLAINPRVSFDNYEIDINKVLLFQIVTIVIYIPETIDTIKSLMSGSTLEDVRILSGEGNRESGILAILKNFLLTPFLFLSYPVTAYIFITNRIHGRKKSVVLFFALLLILISVLRLGGRSPILFFIVNFLVVWYFYRKEIVLTKKSKRIMMSVISLLLIFFVLASISRGIEDLPRSFYHYFAGCIALLDNGLNSINFHTYGIASFSSVISIADTGWRFIGGGELSVMPIIELINENVEETIKVGTDVNMNAFYTLFYWFYIDFGLEGVIVMCFIYGMIADTIYKAAIRNRHVATIMIFSLLMQGVVFSFIRFQFTTFYYFMSFFIIPLILKRKISI